MGIPIFHLQQAEKKAQNKQQNNKQQKEKQQKQQKSQKINPHAQKILEEFDQQLEQLPARKDLKKMLKKCIYGIFTNQRIDAEINFLCDVRQFLNKVKDDDIYYVELLAILENIYFIALDKEIQDKFIHQEPNKMLPVDPQILNKFNPIQDQIQEQQNTSQQDLDNILQQQTNNNNSNNEVYIFEDNQVDEYIIDEDFDEDDNEENEEGDNQNNSQSQNNSFQQENQNQNLDIDYINEEVFQDQNNLNLSENQLIQQLQNISLEEGFSSRIDGNNNNINIQQQSQQQQQLNINQIQITQNNQVNDDKFSIIYEVDENLYGSGDEL